MKTDQVTLLPDKFSSDLAKIIFKNFDHTIDPKEIIFEHPKNPNFGDFSTNVALILNTKYKIHDTNPLVIAQKIKESWENIGLPKEIEKIEVAPPGFLNIWVNTKYLISQLEEVLDKKDEFGKSSIGKRKTVVIDYSAPNIAKPFGIGHLRSTNIGQALYNLYQATGWKTVGDNHLGDWGTQFGKLIYQITTKNLVSKLDELTVNDLEKLYVEFHNEAEKDPKMDEEARDWFKKLESGDLEAKIIWQKCIDISWKEFDRVYEILGVKIDYALGESFYLDKMGEIIDEAKSKNLAYESQGALVIDVPGEKVPLMLIKADGATTYATRDLATIKYRIKTWKPDLFIYEVGADQTLYFRQLFIVAELLGYISQDQFKHIAHGMIRWSTGKFSTRKGDTIHLEDVLNEAISRARKLCDSSKDQRLIKTFRNKGVSINPKSN